MEAAFIVTWKRPFPTRERLSLDYGAEVTEYWEKRAAEGRCTRPETFFLPTGSGMWMVKGEREVIEELMAAEDAQRLLMRGPLLLEDFGHQLAHSGDSATDYLLRYAEAAEALGIL